MKVNNPWGSMIGFILKDWWNQLNIHDVILKNENILFDNLFPHNELFGILFSVDKFKSILCISSICIG